MKDKLYEIRDCCSFCFRCLWASVEDLYWSKREHVRLCSWSLMVLTPRTSRLQWFRENHLLEELLRPFTPKMHYPFIIKAEKARDEWICRKR